MKIHANQKSASGGACLAAELDVVSADHLEHITDSEIEALARVNTVAVLLPGDIYADGERAAPARRLIEHGVPVALATDFNPGIPHTFHTVDHRAGLYEDGSPLRRPL